MRVAPVLLLLIAKKLPHPFAVRNPQRQKIATEVEFYTLALSAQAPGNFLWSQYYVPSNGTSQDQLFKYKS